MKIWEFIILFYLRIYLKYSTVNVKERERDMMGGDTNNLKNLKKKKSNKFLNK